MNSDVHFYIKVDETYYCCNVNLKNVRNKKKFTQSHLAKLVGCSKNTISSIECGEFCPSLPLILKLCIALDCSFYDLFTTF